MKHTLRLTPLALACLACTAPALAQSRDDQTRLLDAVVVTASLGEERADTAPASITVVTGEQIEQSAATSLAEVLGRTAGVQNYNGGGREKLTIRGVRESNGIYTLLMVNGKRISSTGALWRDSDLDISSIPLASIERVEIIRGPMSALYGSDAIGGVINIITRKPTREWHGMLNADYHHLDRGDGKGQYRIGAAASGALGDTLGLSVAAEQYDRDAWFSHGKDASPAYYIEGKKTGNLRSTLSWAPSERQSLDLDLGYNKDERPYGVTDYQYYPAWDYLYQAFASQRIERRSYGLTHYGRWGWGSTTVSAQQEDSDIHDYDSDFDAPQQRTLGEKNTNLRAHANLDAGMHGLVVGMETNRQEVKDAVSYQNSGRASVDTTSVFAQDDMHLAERWTLSLAGRYDDHEVFGGHFSPKAYLVHEIGPSIVVKGGYGQAFKAPSLAQMTRDYGIVSCGGGCTLWGNPGLKPETSENYELGIILRKRSWNVGVTVFQNEIEDMISRTITWDANDNPVAAEWANLDKVRIRGLEVTAGVEILPALSLDANATWLDAKNRQTGLRLEERPRLQANASLNFRPNDRLGFTLGTSHLHDQVYGGRQLPDYTLVNLGMSINRDKFTVRAGVRNLTDVDLEKKGAGAGVTYNGKELGRNYYVGLSYDF